MKYKYLFIAAVFSVFTACERDEPEIQNTSTYPVSGEWWVTYQAETSPGVFEDIGGGYYKFITYNTASNKPDSIWMSDEGNFKDFRIKTALNISTRTFVADKSQNLLYPERIYILNAAKTDTVDSHPGKVIAENGKVLIGEGRSTSGVKTDSIYVEMKFDDDLTNTLPKQPYSTKYIISGHRRTGFLEDEH